MQKKCSAVLFDMDGVLLDSEYDAFQRLEKTLCFLSVIEPTRALLDRYCGMQSRMIYADLIQRHHLQMTVKELSEMHKSRNGNYYCDAYLMPMKGLLKFLKRLQAAKISMAVVSSTRAANVLYALNRMHLLGYFDAIVSGDMVTVPKPNPEGYQKAAEYLQVKPEECIVIEDSTIGIMAAKAAGMRSVGYQGATYKQDVSCADLQAHDYEKIWDWLTAQFYV